MKRRWNVPLDEIRIRSGNYPVVRREPVHVRVEFVKGKELMIYTDTVLSVAIPCDRCLEQVRHEFVINSTKHVDLGLSDAELTEELDESNFIDGYHLDVDRLLSVKSCRDGRKRCSAEKTAKVCAACAART